MRRLYHIIFLLLCVLAARGQQVPEYLQIGYDWADELVRAKKVLVAHGVDKGKLKLTVRRIFNGYCLVGDDDVPCFALVLCEPYASMAGYDGVLAFSTDTELRRLIPSTQWILKDYTRQIQSLEEGTSAAYKGDSLVARVAPLLQGIAWGQGAPLNACCPMLEGDTIAPAGCGAVALGQVLYYYRHPTDVDWAAIQPAYKQGESESASSRAAAVLLARLGGLLKSEYHTTFTRTFNREFPPVLKEHLGYAGSVQHLRGKPAAERMTLLGAELCAGRPVIAQGGNHIFVVDGQEPGFVHINMGWWGRGTGWYRHIITEDGYPPYVEMIVGIRPAE